MLDVEDGSAQEREKYSEIWSRWPQYREHSPGLQNVERFMSVMKPKKGESLIDLGCGEGVAGLAFEKHGLAVEYLDITDKGLKPEVDGTRFHLQPLWNELPRRCVADTTGDLRWERFDYAFCCDVIEHIPTEFVMLCIANIARISKKAWIQIALRPDEFGTLIGEPLHLTVQPFAWWLTRIACIANVVDARDLCGDGLYIIESQ